MNVAITLLVFVVILFLLAFFSKRRFGVLGLALAAGYVLHRLWEAELNDWAFSLTFLNSLVISPITIVGLVVLLVPSLLLIFSGPVYKSMYSRILGSILYAVLAVLFGLGALSGSLDLSGSSKQVFDFVMTNRDYILTVALAAAVVDVMYIHSSKRVFPKGK